MGRAFFVFVYLRRLPAAIVVSDYCNVLNGVRITNEFRKRHDPRNSLLLGNPLSYFQSRMERDIRLA
jgi:hypothetical protein